MTDLVESDGLRQMRGMVRWFRLLTILSSLVLAWSIEGAIFYWHWISLVAIAMSVWAPVLFYRQYRVFKRDVALMRSIEESLAALQRHYPNESAFHHHAEQVEAGMAQMLRRLRR